MPKVVRYHFAVLASADLTDGFQADELDGSGPVFVFDGREVEHRDAITRRSCELNADGSGLIQNSNNLGGVNPISMEVVDVDFGEEYITTLCSSRQTR